ncbi:MAG: serine hydrolase domain-containing protein [Chthoniobacteraceae bacterium]
MDVAHIKTLFRENFTHFGDLGASLSGWSEGREVVSLAEGWCDRNRTQPWTADTPVLVWSATKGPAAACVLHAMQERGLTLDTRVADVWPEFAAHGKGALTIGGALSHQSGVPALDRIANILDHDDVARAIAEQAPYWEPGTAVGYGPRLYGFLLDELVRRIAGRPLGEYWRAVFAEPLALDFWMGVPADLVDAVAPIFPPKAAPPKERFYTAFVTPGSLTLRAFGSPEGLKSVVAMNAPGGRRASLPGFGGIGTAAALAKFYAMLAAGGSLHGRTFFKAETLAWMTTTLVQGDDRVLLTETAFSAGFMRDPLSPDGKKLRAIFGPSLAAFGHPGAGGSHAFADPEHRIAFAYVINQMEPGVFPGPKALRLVEAVCG